MVRPRRPHRPGSTYAYKRAARRKRWGGALAALLRCPAYYASVLALNGNRDPATSSAGSPGRSPVLCYHNCCRRQLCQSTQRRPQCQEIGPSSTSRSTGAAKSRARQESSGSHYHQSIIPVALRPPRWGRIRGSAAPFARSGDMVRAARRFGSLRRSGVFTSRAAESLSMQDRRYPACVEACCSMLWPLLGAKANERSYSLAPVERATSLPARAHACSRRALAGRARGARSRTRFCWARRPSMNRRLLCRRRCHNESGVELAVARSVQWESVRRISVCARRCAAEAAKRAVYRRSDYRQR